MKTLRELYCAGRHCREEDFVRGLFWRCLHRRAVAVAPALLLARPDYFQPDRDLIASAGRARSMQELSEDVRDYVLDSRNRPWWRRRALVRLSTHRLRALAQLYLGSPGTTARRTLRPIKP